MTIVPGSLLKVKVGSRCIDHSHRRATKRVVVEADSAGYEDISLCEECYEKFKEAHEKRLNEPCQCNLCHVVTTDCRPFKDPSEGQSGPVYTACADCRKRITLELIGDDEFESFDEQDSVQLVLGGSCHSELDDYDDD